MEATGDLIGNEIADKVTTTAKRPPRTSSKTVEKSIEIRKERCISKEKRQ